MVPWFLGINCGMKYEIGGVHVFGWEERRE